MNSNFNNSTVSTVNPEQMSYKETICTRCIHAAVCEYMSSYCNILEQIDGLNVHIPFEVDLSCKYFQPTSVLRGDVK